MAIMEALVERLSAEQAPVICLDTCDFLNVVRGIAEGNLIHVAAFRRMLDTLDLDPKRFQLLITYLVKHEWERNRVAVERTVEGFLANTYNSVGRVANARNLAGLPTLPVKHTLFDPELIRNLVELARSVMDLATVIEKDDSSVALALERVMAQTRPSHKNEIKDSIHWEHYLELSRQLKSAGHIQSRIFVSANKEDFWHKEEKVYFPTIHKDLQVEAGAAGLQFFGKLDDALRSLGI